MIGSGSSQSPGSFLSQLPVGLFLIVAAGLPVAAIISEGLKMLRTPWSRIETMDLILMPLAVVFAAIFTMLVLLGLLLIADFFLTICREIIASVASPQASFHKEEKS